ncbi:MAG: SPOR domain-containing protein [Thiomicrospira sp.]|jgi:cell division septation protein DedD|nr:SPOR domain-containing protein [Thiomicrospira sp.]
MARDFRHGYARRQGFMRKSQQADSETPATGLSIPRQRIGWGVALLSLALLATFFVVKHFASSSSRVAEPAVMEVYQVKNESLAGLQQASDSAAVVQTDRDDVPDAPQASDADETRYTFYVDLPQMEMVVDAEPLPIKLPEPMWLQAGSFRDVKQAQTEQQRLARSGYEVEIAPIESRNGVFYRMMIGPFTDRLELNKARNQIRRLGADTRIVRTPPATPSTR